MINRRVDQAKRIHRFEYPGGSALLDPPYAITLINAFAFICVYSRSFADKLLLYVNRRLSTHFKLVNSNGTRN